MALGALLRRKMTVTKGHHQPLYGFLAGSRAEDSLGVDHPVNPMAGRGQKGAKACCTLLLKTSRRLLVVNPGNATLLPVPANYSSRADKLQQSQYSEVGRRMQMRPCRLEHTEAK